MHGNSSQEMTDARENLRRLLPMLTPTELDLLRKSAPAIMAADELQADHDDDAPLTLGPMYFSGHAVPTAFEVLLMTVLLVVYFENNPKLGRAKLREWQRFVETDAARQQQLGDTWAPLNDSSLWNSQGGILRPLKEAITVRMGPSGVVETAAAVVAAWRHPGGRIDASPEALDIYLSRLVRPKKDKKALLGPKYNEKGHASARHVSAIPAIAALLSEHDALIRHLVERHAIESSFANETKAELRERVEVENMEVEVEHDAALKARDANISRLEGEVTALKAKVVTEQKGKSKAQIRAGKLDATKKGTAKRVRDEEKGRAKEKISQIKAEAKAQAEEIVKAEIKRLKQLKASAHEQKRVWKQRAENGEHLAEIRLSKIKGLEEKIEEKITDIEDLEEMVTDEVTEIHAEAFRRLQSMPTWNLVRPDGGRGGAQFEDIYTTTIFEMMGNGTPQSAIGKNVVAVLRRAAPWLKVRKITDRALNDKRFQLRTAEETLAAIEVATAFAIRMLGFDETTKFGNPSITSNLVIQPEEGGKLKVVILRGAYCSGGGTSEKIAAAIEKKCFARLKDLLVKLKAMFEKLYPREEYPGPDPSKLSMARLAGGGALISDTCNGAEKAKAILAEKIAEQMREKIGEEEWGKLSEAEQQHVTRVHKLDCWQHMRNIFLKEMSAAQSKLVAEELQPQLDTFSSWERMSTDMDQLLRASEKEFHHHCRYYKGKGRDWGYHLKSVHPTAFVVHFERAEGGRYDLDYDAAIPMYINRKFMVQFLHPLIFGGNHSNILEDFLYITYTTIQFIAMIRANAILDLLVSRPLRWLSGKAHELDSFSPVTLLTIKEGKALHAAPIDLVEALFKKGEANGAALLDGDFNGDLDIFRPVADVQPAFADYRTYMYEKETILAPDGKTKHLIYQKVREELFNPVDPTNQKTRQKTIEYLEAQCTAGLRKMHDKKLAISKHLISQDGASSFANAELMHVDTIGLDGTNDRLAESVFGRLDMIMKRFPGISLEAASALVQAMSTGNFEEGGFFYKLPEKLQHAVLEMARSTLKEMRTIDAADHVELNEYQVMRRKTNSQEELEALIKEYAFALSFFDRWMERGVKDAKAMRAALDAFKSHADVVALKGVAVERKINQLRLDYLREQIEMRVRGLGFVEFRPRMAWSSGKDEEVGTVSELTALLEDILMEERELECCDELPTAAVVPVMKRKTLKTLGEPTPQGQELGESIQNYDSDELLDLAEKRRKELEAAGEIDEVADKQPEEPPSRNDESIVAEEKAKGEKRTKIAVKIWCEGEVVAIANGTTDKQAPQSKNVLAKGALRIRFPEDVDRKEKEHYVWHMFQDEDWYGKTGKDAHLSWRYAARTLCKLAEQEEAAGGSQRARKQRK